MKCPFIKSFIQNTGITGVRFNFEKKIENQYFGIMGVELAVYQNSILLFVYIIES